MDKALDFGKLKFSFLIAIMCTYVWSHHAMLCIAKHLIMIIGQIGKNHKSPSYKNLGLAPNSPMQTHTQAHIYIHTLHKAIPTQVSFLVIIDTYNHK